MTTKFMSALAAVGALVAGVSSCATSSPRERLAAEVRGPEGPRVGEVSGRTAVVHDDALVGFDTRLTRAEDGARGVLFGRTVDVRFNEVALSGQINARPARLSVEQGPREAPPGAVEVVGTLEGAPVELTVTNEGWSGRLQGCTIDFERVAHGFVGDSSCAPLAEPSALVLFPEELASAPLPEQILYVALSFRSGEREVGAPEAVERLRRGG